MDRFSPMALYCITPSCSTWGQIIKTYLYHTLFKESSWVCPDHNIKHKNTSTRIHTQRRVKPCHSLLVRGSKSQELFYYKPHLSQLVRSSITILWVDFKEVAHNKNNIFSRVVNLLQIHEWTGTICTNIIKCLTCALTLCKTYWSTNAPHPQC